MESASSRVLLAKVLVHGLSKFSDSAQPMSLADQERGSRLCVSNYFRKRAMCLYLLFNGVPLNYDIFNMRAQCVSLTALQAASGSCTICFVRALEKMIPDKTVPCSKK